MQKLRFEQRVEKLQVQLQEAQEEAELSAKVSGKRLSAFMTFFFIHEHSKYSKFDLYMILQTTHLSHTYIFVQRFKSQLCFVDHFAVWLLSPQGGETDCPAKLGTHRLAASTQT